MDWLLNIALVLAIGYFILMTRKRKNTSDNLPRYTTKRSKVDVEKESQETIKCELSRHAPPYETIRSYENPYNGFLDYYLRNTKNDETMTTTAKLDIVQALSKNDLLWDLKLRFNYFKNFIINK